jgi:hypothetical protein
MAINLPTDLTTLGKVNGTLFGLTYRYNSNGQLVYDYYAGGGDLNTTAQQEVRQRLQRQAYYWHIIAVQVHNTYVKNQKSASIWSRYVQKTANDFDLSVLPPVLNSGLISNDLDFLALFDSLQVSARFLFPLLRFQWTSNDYDFINDITDELWACVYQTNGTQILEWQQLGTRVSGQQTVDFTNVSLPLLAECEAFLFWKSVSLPYYSKIAVVPFQVSLL